MADAHDKKEEAKAAAPAAAGGGGMKAFLPLMLAIVLMPGLAYVMTSFVLVPRLQKALGTSTVSARENEEGSEEASGKAEGGHDTHESKPAPKGGGGHGSGGHGGGGKGAKTKVQLSKIVVNVSGSLGTRMLLASVTLAGKDELKTKVEENTDQLRDIASSILGSKTIADLEKPEARNLIRAELLSQFNSALGGGVQEIFITELAIQ